MAVVKNRFLISTRDNSNDIIFVALSVKRVFFPMNISIEFLADF